MLAAVAAVLLVAGNVRADDQDYNAGLKQELSTEGSADAYPKRPAPAQAQTATPLQVQSVKVQAVQAAPAPVTQAAQPQVQPIYILQQPQSAPLAQVQPTTTVEDVPVKESKIETLRKQREDVEHQTEDKLMQRLEDDRLVSEKDRADRLFVAQPAASPAAVPVLPPPQIVAPVAAPVAVQVPPPAVVQPVANESLTAEVDNSNLAPAPDQDKTKFSVGGLAGVGAYPSSSNISGQYALGLDGNFLLNDGLGVEITGLFSSYRVSGQYSLFNPYGLVQMNQTNVTGGLTYRFLDGRVQPLVGALVGYTRRNYSNLAMYGYQNGFGLNGNGSNGSNAFDGGLMVGVDVALTKKVSIGADFRYMFNLTSSLDNPWSGYNTAFSQTPLESMSYYFADINLKLSL